VGVSYIKDGVNMNDIGMALITVIPILIYKLSVLVVGYLIAKMGYQLLIKGVTGEFKFKSSLQGVKADLVSASPGTFFVLLGVLLMMFSVLKENPYTLNNEECENSTQNLVTEILDSESGLPENLPEGFK